MMKRLMKWMSRPETPATKVKSEESGSLIPAHVAIIMDGNGRWAKERGLPRIAGHRAGMKSVKEITRIANDIGVKILTLYAFSTENWKRPRNEVEYLMKLPQEFLKLELEELIREQVKVTMIGDLDSVPPHTIQAIRAAMEKTRDNTGLNLNFALNYGSRSEIVTAVRKVAESAANGEIRADDVDECFFSNMLFTSGMADPDLLIRTSGELRLSNFLLWQLAYTELWFTDTYWPDFNRDHFMAAIDAYQKRGRRFGGI